jgi:esterase
MDLFCKRYSDVGDPLIILHGLFGNQGNWSQHAKIFANTFSVYGLDQRNHGRSDWQNSMSYLEMANDVRETMKIHEIESANFIGHSMGGKTAMQLALMWPQLVKKLVIVDIAPVSYKPHHDQIFAGLNELNLDMVDSRSDVDEILAEYIAEKSVRDFLLANMLKDEEGNYSWRMNVDVIQKDYPKLIEGLASENPCKKDVLFIRGGNSDYVLPEYEKEILALFPKAQFQTIDGTGHWVHAEQPELFQAAVHKFLK